MTQDLIDETVYEGLIDAVGAEFAAELVTTFLNDAPSILAEMKAAVAAQDADAYRRAAHSIKSNAQVFGAHALADQARDMELAGIDDSSAASVGPLEDTYAQTAQALAGMLDD